MRSPAPPSPAFPKPPAAGHPQHPHRPLPHEGWTSRDKDPPLSQVLIQERGQNQELMNQDPLEYEGLRVLRAQDLFREESFSRTVLS